MSKNNITAYDNIHTLFDSKLNGTTFSDVDNGGIMDIEFEMPLNYELDVTISKSNDPEFPYQTDIILFNFNNDIIATKKNTCLDPLNLSDQLNELIFELIDMELINEKGEENPSTEFEIYLHDSVPNLKKVTITSDNGDVIGTGDMQGYITEPDFENNPHSLTAVFNVQTKEKTNSTKLQDANISFDTDEEIMGANIFITPKAIVMN